MNLMLRGQARLAIIEIVDGFSNWRIWTLMGWQDIVQRYRRSLLGPFWLTISMGIMVGTLGILYGQLFKMRIDDYLPFLTLGFIAWGLIAGIVLDSGQVFVGSERYLKQIKLSHLIFVNQVIFRNLIIFAHNFIIYIVVALVFQINPGLTALLVIPGLLIITLNGVWVALLLGLLSTRFRDISQIIASLMQVLFFVTPIIWKPELIADRKFFVDANPFFHLIELLRAPLLGRAPALISWEVSLGLFVCGTIATFLLYQRYRRRITYWL